MLEKRITGIGRWVTLGGTVMNVVLAVLLVTSAIIAPVGVPLPVRIGVAVGALFPIGFAILGLRFFLRGSIDLKFHTSVGSNMAWVGAVLMVIVFMVMSLFAPDRIAGLWMMNFGLVVLVVGAVFLIRHVIEQSELKTREKLLELEYRLAELAETAKPGKTKD